jgi:hypothetical protein
MAWYSLPFLPIHFPRPGLDWILVWIDSSDLPDGVAGAQTDPLGDGTVLALSFGKLLLGAESLVAL